MANPLADVEKKLNTATLMDEIKGVQQKRNWKLWLLVPLAILTISGCAFLVVRRFKRG